MAALVFPYISNYRAPIPGRDPRAFRFVPPVLRYSSTFPDLSLTGKRWRTPESQQTEHPENILARLRAERGLNDTSSSHGSFPDGARAVARAQRAIAENEHIGIFGDYDCDGVTSSAILVRFFQRRGVHPHVRLPHRIREGYGLSTEVIEEFAAKEITLLITVDTGVTAINEIAQAHAKGIDVIVLDHHHLKPELPPAFAILHPALAPGFPEPYPCAAGIAFMFVELLEGSSWPADRSPPQADEGWIDRETDIALAGIATVADLVPLQGWNRSIVCAGLAALEHVKTGPLSVLVANVRNGTAPLTSRDIAFRIAPRLNAAGRMADPAIALRALLGDNEALRSLSVLNEERQNQTALMLEEVLGTIDHQRSLPFLCCIAEHYPPGIVGLLAGKLTETFGKPSLVGCVQDGVCRASLRSILGYNVMDGLTHIEDVLLSFGGHAQAAGCTFNAADFTLIHGRLCMHLGMSFPCEDLRPILHADAVLAPEHVTLAFCSALQALEPYGQGNAEPRFLLRDVSLERATRVGADKSHLRAHVGPLTVIGFGLGKLAENLPSKVDLACRIGINKWNDRVAPQIVLEDIRLAQSELRIMK